MTQLNIKIDQLSRNKGICILKTVFNINNIDWDTSLNVERVVGGSVIDILEGRTPKDYDILDYNPSNIKNLIQAGFNFKYDTCYSTTFEKEGYIFQFLKTDINNFDFKISQSSFWYRSDQLFIDEISFNNKTLIPVSYEKENIINSLSRIPHWRRKGYTIDDITYQSMISVLNKEVNDDS